LYRCATLIAIAVLASAGVARAADPIMPLSEVRPGMACTGLSVVHGTEISSFDVGVLDVIAGDPAVGGARLLVRVSGPAVDATGVGPGFSGSPVVCGVGRRRLRQQGRAGHADRGDPGRASHRAARRAP
jgi:hypothetical protein